jgi:flagellar hook assembly protein FlgD
VDLSATGVFDDPVPSVFRFHPCFPNPFSQATTMHLALPEVGPVRLRIYSPSGRLVKTVHDGEVPAGNHTFAWDGTDSGGYAVGSGVYFIRLEAGAREDTHKVVLLR